MRQWRWRPQRRAGALKENLQRCLAAHLLWGQWRGWCGGGAAGALFIIASCNLNTSVFPYLFIYFKPTLAGSEMKLLFAQVCLRSALWSPEQKSHISRKRRNQNLRLP